MSGEGGDEHRKQEDAEEPRQEDEEGNSQRPSCPRPATARPGARRRRTISRLDPPGAVGGEGSYRSRVFTEQEMRVGGQAQTFLEMFIMDRMQKESLPTQHIDVVREAVHRDNEQGKQKPAAGGEDYREVSMALREIGDLLSEDYDLNRLIDMVPIQSPREIFMKVCKQMFQDNQFNWGRVVALFYFAYKLITKAVVMAVKDVIPWIKEIFQWAIDFFIQYVAWWIIQRGGWRMIREYWGPSRTTMGVLGVTTILCLIYTLWKSQ